MRRVVPVLLIAAGCRRIEPAPEALDDLLHFLWTELNEDADDARLAEGVVHLDAAVRARRVDGPEDGTVTPLTPAEAALVGVTDRDPRDAAGVFLVNRFACDLDTLAAVLTYPDQDAIYEGVYDDYARTFHGDRDAFLAGGDRLGWTLTYTSSSLVGTYTASAEALIRRVPDLDEVLTPWGPVLFARTYMPEPAVFTNEGKSMPQDYQLEVYWERDRGEILHVYALWRQASFGAGLTSDDEGVQRILLNNLADWDRTTEATCAEGLPGR